MVARVGMRRHSRGMMQGIDFENRMPVWLALSELFLDAELLPTDIRRIAWLLDTSSYDRGALERILIEEVMPAFAPNLLSVAGE